MQGKWSLENQVRLNEYPCNNLFRFGYFFPVYIYMYTLNLRLVLNRKLISMYTWLKYNMPFLFLYLKIHLEWFACLFRIYVLTVNFTDANIWLVVKWLSQTINQSTKGSKILTMNMSLNIRCLSIHCLSNRSPSPRLASEGE